MNAVSWMSFPGAIAPIVKVGDPSWPKIAHALPAVLPTPPNQPRECRAGGITTLWIARGNSQIVYGPCRVPASIAALHCLIPDPATGGPRACKATPPTPTSD